MTSYKDALERAEALGRANGRVFVFRIVLVTLATLHACAAVLLLTSGDRLGIGCALLAGALLGVLAVDRRMH